MKNSSNKRIFGLFEKITYFLGIFMIFFMIIILIYSLFYKNAVVVPVIPGASYGEFKLPFFEVIIAIFISALIHEMFHGIYVYRYGLNLKSWGFFFLGPFLGAFVEPDEKELEKLDNKKKFIIFSSGSSINLVFGLLVLSIYFALSYLITYLIINYPQMFDARVRIESVYNGSPAYYALITPGYLISVDGEKIYTLYELTNILKNKSPGEIINIVTDKGTYNLTLGNINGHPYIGVGLIQEYKYYNIISFILRVLLWIFIISIGIGLANMIPIYPLDGGRALLSLLEDFIGQKRAYRIVSIISVIMISILLYNIMILFI